MLSDILYPARCVLCGEVLPYGKNGACPACYRKLSFVTPPVCMACGKELEGGNRWNAGEFCPDCLRHEKIFSGGIALLNYDASAREIMTGLKYENKRENARFLARELAVRKGHQIRKMRAAALIPVPLHKKKRRQRGYNQAGLLAGHLGAFLDLPVREDILVRTEYTAAQKKLGYEDRQKNEEKAFAACGTLSGTVILVDDIYTTGATAQACTKVLLAAGAQRVFLVNAAVGCGR